MRTLAIFALTVAGCFSAAPADNNNCAPGAQQSCVCSGGGIGTQTCKSDGSGFLPCGGCSNPPPDLSVSAATDGAVDHCSDGVKDGDESDLDCGGSCAPCADGKTCTGSAGCQNANCSNGMCCAAGRGNCDNNAGNGCEVDLQSDAKNCSACGMACGNGKMCKSGGCAAGPVVCQGVQPPKQCDLGVDSESGDPWVVCSANCQNAWISHSEMNGPQFNSHYHALQICQSLGYLSVTKWGCAYECGWCQGNMASCNNPGTEFFDNNGVAGACMNDQFGPVLCGNIMWQCGV